MCVITSFHPSTYKIVRFLLPFLIAFKYFLVQQNHNLWSINWVRHKDFNKDRLCAVCFASFFPLFLFLTLIFLFFKRSLFQSQVILPSPCLFVWTFWFNIPAPLSTTSLFELFGAIFRAAFSWCKFFPLFGFFGAISQLLCPGEDLSLNLDLLVQYFCSFVLVLACRFVWTFWCNIPAPLSWCKLSLCLDFLVQYPFSFVLVQVHWHGLSQFGVGPHSSGSQPQLVHWHTSSSISSISIHMLPMSKWPKHFNASPAMFFFNSTWRLKYMGIFLQEICDIGIFWERGFCQFSCIDFAPTTWCV